MGDTRPKRTGKPKLMKDILGREIKVGDIVAHGTRSGNSGDLNVKIIADTKMTKERWTDHEIEKVKVINFYFGDQEWNKETQKWEATEPHFEKGGIGWSAGGNMLIVNESVPKDVKEFLKSLL